MAQLRTTLGPYFALATPPRVLLAYSGGLDSRLLLELLVRLRRKLPFELRIVHVNHHLQPAAASFARHARSVSQMLDVRCRVRHLRNVARRGESLEARAREARYAILESELRPSELLMTAQHADDQMETLLLQLFRGAGLEGLSGMSANAPFGRGSLLRPLLGQQRSELLALAQYWQLEWVEDPSNREQRFDRNFLRQTIVPMLRTRWPALATTVARSATLLADAAVLIKTQADADLAAARAGDALQIDLLATLPELRQAWVIRAWLRAQHLKLPDQVHLTRMLTELLTAGPDRHPVVQWSGGVVWREKRQLLAARTLVSRLPATTAKTSVRWGWRDSDCQGLRWRPDRRGPIDGSQLPRFLELRTRAGGERLRPSSGGARRPLKDLLREAGVPLRLRSGVPLLYADKNLLAVGALWVNYDHPAVGGGGSEAGRFELARGKRRPTTKSG